MKSLIWFAPLFVFLSACGQSSGGSEEFSRMETEYADEQAMKQTNGRNRDASTDPGIPRRIIRKARLEVETDNLERATAELTDIIDRFSARVDGEQHYRYGHRLETRWTLRVEPKAFDTLLLALGELGQLREKQVSSDDVTRQYVDLEARLNAKRAAEKRYRQLMSQAANVQEVLSVEAELRKLIEELEATEAQLRSLRDQVQRSTVELTLFQPLARPVEGPSSFARRLGRAFSSGWALLQDLFVGFIGLWPLWLVLTGLWFGWRSYRRLRGKRKA